MVMQTWRRSPPGALAQQLSSGRMWPMSKSFMNLSEDEFADALKAEGCSDKYIAQEVKIFRELKASRGRAQETVQERRATRRTRPVTESMDPFVEAEIRRTAGVAADEVLESLKRK